MSDAWAVALPACTHLLVAPTPLWPRTHPGPQVMTPTYTMGLHAMDESTKWTTSDALCYFDGF